MHWIALFLILGVVLTCFQVRRRIKRNAETALKYHFEFSTDELFEKEYLYLKNIRASFAEKYTSP